jgi:hypothetical protein
MGQCFNCRPLSGKWCLNLSGRITVSKLAIQALDTTQKLLLNLRGQQQEILKRNALLENSAAKGWKKLTRDELELAVKEEAIRLLGCKYSITHCLWINPQIFPLCAHPDEGSTILLGCRTMLGECCLAATQPKGFWTKLRAQERESVCV